MESLIVFGTVAFWIFAIILIAALIITFEIYEKDYHEDSGGGLTATIILIVAAAIYYFVGSSEHLRSIWEFITSHTATAIAFVALYFAAGVVWSFFKWFFYLRTVRERYEKREINIRQADIPLAKNNINRISTWISYWVVSLLWTLINDPVRKFCRFLVFTFGSFYDRMSNQAFAGIVKAEEPKNGKNTL